MIQIARRHTSVESLYWDYEARLMDESKDLSHTDPVEREL